MDDHAGARIRYLRLLLQLEWRVDISQVQFAQLVGKVMARRLATNSGSRWEAAAAPPPDRVLEAIERLTGASRAWIRYGAAHGTPAPRFYAETGGEGAVAPDWAVALLAERARKRRARGAPPPGETAAAETVRRERRGAKTTVTRPGTGGAEKRRRKA